MFFKASRFFLFASVFFVVLVSTSTLFPFIVGKYSWFRGMVDLSFIAFLLGLVWDNRADEMKGRFVKAFKSPLGIAVGVFTLMFLLASIFGVDPSFSFWSNFERGEGGLQFLHLYVFFLLLSTLMRHEDDWKKMFILSVVAGMLMVFYGVGAGLKYVDAEYKTQIQNGQEVSQMTGRGGVLFNTFNSFIGPQFSAPDFRFQGSIGNPAYVAAYLIFTLFFVLYLLISRYKGNLNSFGAWILMASALVSLIFIYLTQTRGAFLGLIAGALAFVGYIVYSSPKWRKTALIVAVIGLAIVSTLVYFQDSQFVQNLPGSRIFRISFTQETFQHRTIMWNIAWEGFKERPIFGYGPENYMRIFDSKFDTSYYVPGQPFGAWFDRAHSVIFDYLSETGILGLLSYLGMFVMFYIQFFRTRNKEKDSPVMNGLVFALPVAYLVQGVILFDILPISYNLFLFLAFAYFYSQRNQEIKRNER